MTHKLKHQPYSTIQIKPSYEQLEQECKDRADCEKSLTNWNIETGDKNDKLEKENAELRACCSDVCEFLKKLKQQANQTTEKPLFSKSSLSDWLSTYINKLEGGKG